MADAPVAISLYSLLEPGGDVTLKDASMVRVLTAFANSGKVLESCVKAGVSRSSWYRWIEDNPDFRNVVQQILEIRQQRLDERVVAIEEKVYELAEGGDMQAAKVVLVANRAKYREKQVIEVVSPDVQNRLVRQADTIMQLCAMELPEPYKSTFATKLATALREVWS